MVLDGGKGAFERNSVDEFVVQGPDVGQIKVL